MSIPLYMDVHIPVAITEALRLRGVDVITAQEDKAAELSDAALLDRSTMHQRVLFTFDDDLLAEARRRQLRRIPFAGLVYAHSQYVTIGDCVRDLELVAKASEPQDFANQVLFLPL